MTGPSWARAEGALWRQTAQGVVVLCADGQAATALTGLRNSVWQVLGEPATAEAVAARARTTAPALHIDDQAISDALHHLVALGVVRQLS